MPAPDAAPFPPFPSRPGPRYAEDDDKEHGNFSSDLDSVWVFDEEDPANPTHRKVQWVHEKPELYRQPAAAAAAAPETKHSADLPVHQGSAGGKEKARDSAGPQLQAAAAKGSVAAAKGKTMGQQQAGARPPVQQQGRAKPATQSAALSQEAGDRSKVPPAATKAQGMEQGRSGGEAKAAKAGGAAQARPSGVKADIGSEGDKGRGSGEGEQTRGREVDKGGVSEERKIQGSVQAPAAQRSALPPQQRLKRPAAEALGEAGVDAALLGVVELKPKVRGWGGG